MEYTKLSVIFLSLFLLTGFVSAEEEGVSSTLLNIEDPQDINPDDDIVFMVEVTAHEDFHLSDECYDMSDEMGGVFEEGDDVWDGVEMIDAEKTVYGENLCDLEEGESTIVEYKFDSEDLNNELDTSVDWEYDISIEVDDMETEEFYSSTNTGDLILDDTLDAETTGQLGEGLVEDITANSDVKEGEDLEVEMEYDNREEDITLETRELVLETDSGETYIEILENLDLPSNDIVSDTQVITFETVEEELFNGEFEDDSITVSTSFSTNPDVDLVAEDTTVTTADAFDPSNYNLVVDEQIEESNLDSTELTMEVHTTYYDEISEEDVVVTFDVDGQTFTEEDASSTSFSTTSDQIEKQMTVDLSGQFQEGDVVDVTGDMEINTGDLQDSGTSNDIFEVFVPVIGDVEWALLGEDSEFDYNEELPLRFHAEVNKPEEVSEVYDPFFEITNGNFETLSMEQVDTLQDVQEQDDVDYIAWETTIDPSEKDLSQFSDWEFVAMEGEIMLEDGSYTWLDAFEMVHAGETTHDPLQEETEPFSVFYESSEEDEEESGEEIPSYIVGQTAEGQLDIQANVYQDYYHNDGEVSYVHATNYFTDVDEGTILEQGEWEDIGLWEKGEADEGSYGTFEVDYTADFQETRFDTGRFAFGVVIVQSENEVDVESLNEDDLSLEDWGEYEHTEIDRVEYEFAVVESTEPVGVIESLNNFFSGIVQSITESLEQTFSDGQLQLPQLDNPPTVS